MRAVVLLGALAALVAAQGMPPALVEVAKVEKKTVAAGRTFVGTIRPFKESVVGAEVAGRVAEMLVREGDRVKTGQVIARLRSRLIEVRIEAAKGGMKLAEAQLDELKNGTRPEEIEQAKARVARDVAEIEYRAWQLEQAEKLFERKSTTGADVRESRFALKAAEASLKQNEAALKLAIAGPRKEKIAQAWAIVGAEQAKVAELVEELDRHTVKAPFDGWIISKRAEVGQWVSTGDPVAVVASLKTVEMVVPVPQAAIQGIRIGQKVEVDVVGRHAGEIVAIVPQADMRGRTFPVRIRLQNPLVNERPQLKSGMLARVTLAVGEKRPTLLVPKDAVVLGGPAPIVWAIDEKSGGGRIVPVTLGAGYGEKVGVIGPLKEGERVVVRGNERLMPGQKLRIKE